MRTHWIPLIVLSAALGCADAPDPDPQDAATQRIEACSPDTLDQLEHVELAALPPAVPGAGIDLDPPATDLAPPAAGCACDDPRCLAEWIGDEIGCGVCAHVPCGDRMAGACVRCDPAGDDAWCFAPPADDLAL